MIQSLELVKTGGKVRFESNKFAHFLKRKWTAPLSVLMLYTLAVGFADPSGNFPLNDDWCYARSVNEFLKTGRIEMGGSIANCYLHILLGGFVCKLAGFSHFSLRCMGLFWGALAILSMWLVLNELKINKRLSLLVLVVFAFNPLVFFLSFTYMTDLPQIALCNLFLFLTVRALRRNEFKLLLIGSLFLDISLLFRQVGSAYLPCGLALIWLFRHQKPKMVAIAISHIVFPAAITFFSTRQTISDPVSKQSIACFQLGFDQFLSLVWNQPIMAVLRLVQALGECSFFIALFSFPFLLAFAAKFLSSKRKLPLITCLAPLLVLIVTLTNLVGIEGKLMPFTQNLFLPPFTCPQCIIGGVEYLLDRSASAWLTVISAVLAYVLLSTLLLLLPAKALSDGYSAEVFRNFTSRHPVVFFMTIALTSVYSCLVLQMMSRNFDRYYLLVLPTTLIALSIVAKKLRLGSFIEILGVVLSLLLCLYSTLSVAECMNGHRARWTALEQLRNAGVPSNQIDGGWDYNLLNDLSLNRFWQLEGGQVQFILESRGSVETRAQRWWPINSEEYIVCKTRIKGYRTVGKVPYWSPMRMQKKEILILKKRSASREPQN